MPSSPGRFSCGSMYHTSATTAHDDISDIRCCVNDCRRLCQNVSANVLLYLIAMGTTLHPKSNAPRLNMTQYSLFTHVPSGKMSSGRRSGSLTCSQTDPPFVLLRDRAERRHLRQYDVVDHRRVVRDVDVPRALVRLGTVVLDDPAPGHDVRRGVHLHELPLELRARLPAEQRVHDAERGEEEELRAHEHGEPRGEEDEVPNDHADDPRREQVEIPVPRRVLAVVEAPVERVVHDRVRGVFEDPARV
eukprot:22149-Pelagococcus_subviridis.AAC.3